MVSFWDNLMRKKGLFLLLLTVFVLTGLVTYNFFTNYAKSTNQHNQNDLNIAEQPSSGYVNSLIIKIQDGYELTFTNNFTKAQIKVTNAALSNPASIRIFDKNGKLMVGEYTTMVEPEAPETEVETSTIPDDVKEGDADAPTLPPVQYILSDTPKSYTLNLEIGDTIEISSPDATVLSSLSGTIAQNFTPSATTETYVVMLAGLRKSTWDVKQGNCEMYELVHNYFASALRQYEAEMPDEVLNNKNLDTQDKAQALVAYYQLTADDQAEFRDFIENVKRGGSPQISYTGRTEYTVGEKVDFADLVTVTDPEDGEVEKVTIQTDANLAKVGNYQLTILATDSDKNTSALDVNIAVINNYTNEVTDKNQESDGKGEAQDINTGVSSLYPSSITTIIGSLIAEQEANNAVDGTPDTQEPKEPTETTPDTPTTITNQPPMQQLDESNSDETEKDGHSNGLKIWHIILGIVAIVGIVGMIRFISDHYIR